MSENIKLSEAMFPNITKTPEETEALYPPRGLPEGARVSRSAPSPTGYLHLGVLFQALIASRVAHDSKGVFFTRIEDTDKKREVAGGLEDIINGFLQYGIVIDEGFVTPDKEAGDYGPYRQSERRDIYQ